MRAARLLPALAMAMGLAGCGYRVAGRADLLPKNINIIAIPPFGNLTVRYRLPERLAGAITREFISRTRYHVVADPNEADAVLEGHVINYQAYPTTIDPATGRASAVQAHVRIALTLRDRGGVVLFSRPDVEFRERYEISSDQQAYLEESDLAMERLSRDVARMVVAAVLENF